MLSQVGWQAAAAAHTMQLCRSGITFTIGASHKATLSQATQRRPSRGQPPPCLWCVRCKWGAGRCSVQARLEHLPQAKCTCPGWLGDMPQSKFDCPSLTRAEPASCSEAAATSLAPKPAKPTAKATTIATIAACAALAVSQAGKAVRGRRNGSLAGGWLPARTDLSPPSATHRPVQFTGSASVSIDSYLKVDGKVRRRRRALHGWL